MSEEFVNFKRTECTFNSRCSLAPAVVLSVALRCILDLRIQLKSQMLINVESLLRLDRSTALTGARRSGGRAIWTSNTRGVMHNAHVVQ